MLKNISKNGDILYVFFFKNSIIYIKYIVKIYYIKKILFKN